MVLGDEDINSRDHLSRKRFHLPEVASQQTPQKGRPFIRPKKDALQSSVWGSNTQIVTVPLCFISTVTVTVGNVIS